MMLNLLQLLQRFPHPGMPQQGPFQLPFQGQGPQMPMPGQHSFYPTPGMPTQGPFQMPFQGQAPSFGQPPSQEPTHMGNPGFDPRMGFPAPRVQGYGGGGGGMGQGGGRSRLMGLM